MSTVEPTGEKPLSERECRAIIVETTTSIQCPYCGQKFDLVVDASIASQRFTTDCEICCRPMEVLAECEAGEVVYLQITEG